MPASKFSNSGGLSGRVKYSNFLAGNDPFTTDMELIETQILSSNTATVSFNVSSYASTYKHLQVRLSARSTYNAAVDNMTIWFNSDTTANKSTHSLYTNGTSVSANNYSSQSYMFYPSQLAGSTVTTGFFTAGVIDIYDAYSSVKNKTLRSFHGHAQAICSISSGNAQLAAPIGTISFGSSANFLAGSRFSVYGIKG